MKALLVLDEMPEKCEDCKFYRCQTVRLDEGKNFTATQSIGFCRVENPSKPIARYLKQSKPDWCPLKEAPERMDWDKVAEHDATDSDYIYGWNDCLDEILREGD